MQSTNNIQNIIDDLGDILLDFSDGGYYYNVLYKFNGKIIDVEIGDGVKMIDLHQFGDTLLRLMDYMESGGWRLNNGLYAMNDKSNWQIFHPECINFLIERKYRVPYMYIIFFNGEY